MRPLILLLLLAITAEAQTLADVARKERQRQVEVHSRRLITTEDAKPVILPEPGQVVTSLPSVPAVAVPPAVSKPVAVPSIDPVQKYQEEITRLGVKLRDLQTQETALQLQINDSSNKFNAPVTDVPSRADAQARMVDGQNRLATVRADLDLTRKALEVMEASRPPAPAPAPAAK